MELPAHCSSNGLACRILVTDGFLNARSGIDPPIRTALPGTPELPVTTADIDRKFRDNAARALTGDAAERAATLLRRHITAFVARNFP